MTETAPPVDLRPDHWTIVCDVLRRHIPDRKVVAFGSRATWTAKDYSDLDLAILGDDPLPLDTMSALAESFGESDLPFKVDLVEWTSIDEAFRKIIRRDGVNIPTLGTVSVSFNHFEDSVNIDWRTATIDEVSEKVAMGPFGSSIKVETFVPEGVPIVSGQHLHGTRVDDSPGYNFISEDHAARLGKANVKRGDIVFTHAGNIGQVAYIPENSEYKRYVISQRQFCLRCDRSNAIPEFITAYFKSPEGQHKLLANASQVGVPSIAQPVTYLRTVEIPLPPISEQRAIAQILGTLEDKIELNKRMNKTLEAMVRTVFKDWFVDFDPVRAKLEGRGPSLPQRIANLFPGRFFDSELGEIPEGWENSEIGKEVDVVGGATPSTKESAYWDEGENHWATPKDLSKLSSPVLLETERKITDAGIDKITSGLLPVGTVLLSSRAPIGYLAIARVRTAINQGFIAMICENRLSNLFVLFWCYENLEYIKSIAGGSTFSEISKKAFRPIPVTVPSDEVLSEYDGLIRPLYNRIVANTIESGNLAYLRDILLPKLVSGELSVKDAEILLQRWVQ